MKKRASILTLSLFAATTAFAHMPTPAGAGDEDAIAYRKATMEAIGGNTHALGLILQGKVDHKENLAIHLDGIALATPAAKAAFMAKVPGGKTKDSAWEEHEKFLAGFDKLKTSAEAAAASVRAGGDDMMAAITAVFDNCKGCHEDYKKKDD